MEMGNGNLDKNGNDVGRKLGIGMIIIIIIIIIIITILSL